MFCFSTLDKIVLVCPQVDYKTYKTDFFYNCKKKLDSPENQLFCAAFLPNFFYHFTIVYLSRLLKCQWLFAFYFKLCLCIHFHTFIHIFHTFIHIFYTFIHIFYTSINTYFQPLLSTLFV